MHEANFLTPREAASLLGVKLGTIYRWVHIRRIPYRKHGRLLKFEKSVLLEWSKSQEIKHYS